MTGILVFYRLVFCPLKLAQERKNAASLVTTLGNSFWLAKFQLLSDPNVVSNAIGNEVTFLNSPKNLVKSPIPVLCNKVSNG